MKDFSTSTYQRKKVSANRVKVQRKPIDWSRYLRPLGRISLWVGGTALVCAVLMAGYRTLSSVTLFRLKDIEVSTTKRLSREDVLAIASVEPGRDLLRMNLKRMGEQLARNPWVETVRINRYFPDRLAISITEREPLAVVNMGYIYYLDRKGQIFKVLNQGDRLDYPVVTGFSEEDVTADPAGTREALKNTCNLLKVLQEKGGFILADVSEIHYDKGFGFTLFTASGALPVKIGASDFSGKVERFARIYRDLMAQGQVLQYIDLDYSDKVIIKKTIISNTESSRGGHVSSKKG